MRPERNHEPLTALRSAYTPLKGRQIVGQGVRVGDKGTIYKSRVAYQQTWVLSKEIIQNEENGGVDIRRLMIAE